MSLGKEGLVQTLTWQEVDGLKLRLLSRRLWSLNVGLESICPSVQPVLHLDLFITELCLDSIYE